MKEEGKSLMDLADRTAPQAAGEDVHGISQYEYDRDQSLVSSHRHHHLPG